MASSALIAIAQVAINCVSDTIERPGFGFNLSSFAVVTPGSQYTIELDESSNAPNDGVSYLIEQRGADAARPLLVNSLPNPQLGVDIANMGYDGVGPVASLNTLVITAVRWGSPIPSPS